MDTPGKRIKALRETKRLSGAELARRIQVKPPSLWALENTPGLEPSGKTLALLCLELRTTPEFVMFGAGDASLAEIEMQAAEVLYCLRHTSPEGRIAILAAARGLASPPPSPDSLTKTLHFPGKARARTGGDKGNPDKNGD